MNKKLIELLDKINSKKSEVKALAEAGKITEAKAAKNELQRMQEQYDILSDMTDVTDTTHSTANAVGATNTFAACVRRLPTNALTEGTDANGGYIVPQDVQTRINHYKDSHRSVRELVTVEPVSTNKGSRVYETRKALTGFAKVDETGKLQAMTEPSFEQVTFAIKDYGGYLPVSNDLLHDTDVALEDEIVSWVGRNALATDNREVFALAKAATAVELAAGIDGIRHAITVTIGSAYDSKIITNDDGVDYLDQLHDTNDRPLLNPDPTAPTKLQLRCGSRVVPVEVFSNADLPSDTTSQPGKTIIPFILGDLAEAIRIYDRQQTTLMASNTASVVDAEGKSVFNAFQQRGVLYRADMRADYKTVDSKAIVYGKMVLPQAAAAAKK